MYRSKIPPLMTIGIVFIILCIAITVRGSLTSKDKLIKPTVAEYTDQNSIVQNMPIAMQEFKYLADYLSRTQINLTSNQRDTLTDKIASMNAIINREKVSEISGMSLDARELAIHITEDIYALYGLNLRHNINGDIVKITGTNGNSVYENNILSKQADFHLSTLVIILTTLVLLLSNCIIIAKKNQLFMKDGVYHGLHEKKIS